MTKEEVLKDIDKLYEDLDNCSWDIYIAARREDIKALNEATIEASRLVLCSLQELSFLRDYIEENIKGE